MSPPELLRLSLAQARTAGLTFDDAWPEALEHALSATGDPDWKPALQAIAGAWSRAEMPVGIKRWRSDHLGGRWREEVRTTRHFCVAPDVDYDRPGLDDDGTYQADDCYSRAVAAITGTTTARPDLGMEWRLVKVGEDGEAARAAVKPLDAERPAVAYWLAGIDGIGHRARAALIDAYVDAARAAAMTDDELLGIEGVGPATVKALRRALEHETAA